MGKPPARDLRLAYVQHPFPAQGRTTDTTHLIVAEHVTQEGSYVALTRAREETHIDAGNGSSDQLDVDDRLQTLAERMGRTEPDVPSIHVPLAHETAVAAQSDRLAGQPEGVQEGHARPSELQEPGRRRDERLPERQPAEIRADRPRPIEDHLTPSRGVERLADRDGDAIDREVAILEDEDDVVPVSRLRRWPSFRPNEPESREVALEGERERERSRGWEP